MRVAFVATLFLTACASRAELPPPASSEVVTASSEPPAEAVAGPAPVPQEDDKTLRPIGAQSGAEVPYVGVLDRQGLIGVVEQGLGRVLSRMKLSPVIVGGKFQGFRVNEIDPSWAASGVQVHDVVVRLNGQSIERPEQALVAFESLRVASEMALELLRGGEKIALRYRIE